MNPDPYTLIYAAVTALVAGGIVGGIVAALALRARRLDEAGQAGRAFRDLRDIAVRYAAPEHRAAVLRDAARIWDRWQPDAFHLAAPSPAAQTPDYAHRLVDALETGQPLNFRGCWVPPDIQGRLRAITASAAPPAPRRPGGTR